MARETKHTPGPWVMQIPQESNGYVNIQMGDKFASVYGDVVDNIGCPSEESVATARLISKAPEMLEMLKECASVLRWALDNTKPDSDWETFTNSIMNAMTQSEELIKTIEG